MVKIRLRRVGARKQPSYRIVAVDSHKPQNGAFLDNIGHFNPRTNPEIIVINEERALYWLQQGAKPTTTVARLLAKTGIMEKFQPTEEKT